MPEPNEHTETLRAGTPLAVGSVTLLPIERVVTYSDQGNTTAWLSMAKEPYALVVCDAGGIRAIDTNAMAVSLAELRDKVPGLGALLASM
jgi:hypothetical protein